MAFYYHSLIVKLNKNLELVIDKEDPNIMYTYLGLQKLATSWFPSQSVAYLITSIDVITTSLGSPE